MKRVLGFLLLCAALSRADGKAVAEFRLAKDPGAVLRGWILEFDEDGFRFQRFGSGRKLTVAWGDLVADDRAELRRRLKLDVSEDERLGLMDGHRLHFKGGGHVDGLLVRIDDTGRHWLRKDGSLLPYPDDRVARVEKIKVKEIDVYDADEVYLRRLRRIPPATARQHRDLADHLYDIGSFAKARRHYEEAVGMRPGWRAEIQPRLEEIDALQEDIELARVLGKVRATYRLRKDYAGARAKLNRFLNENPARRRAALSVLDDLEARQERDTRRRLHVLKHEEVERAIENRLRARPELDEALSWVRTDLSKEVRRRLVERLGLTPEQVEAYLQEKPGSSPHWASYGSGSFTFSRRAKKGKSTRKAIRGDPESWWNAYPDNTGKASFLRAYAAERLPNLFELVEVRLKDCERCGGTGVIRRVSARQIQGSGHEWKQICPRCFGARRDRSVAYR